MPTLSISCTDPVQIIGFLKNFDNKLSPDGDGITLKLLEFVAFEIAQPLSYIFNQN